MQLFEAHISLPKGQPLKAEEGSQGRKLIHQISSGISGGPHPPPDPAGYHHRVSNDRPFIPRVDTAVLGTRNGITGLHQLPLPPPNSSVFCPSPFLLPPSLPPQGSSQAPRTSCRRTEAEAALLGTGRSASIAGNNLSDFLEHHTSNDTSRPVHLHTDGLQAAVPSSCYWPSLGDAGQVSQGLSLQHPALPLIKPHTLWEAFLTLPGTKIQHFYPILAEPMTHKHSLSTYYSQGLSKLMIC